MAASGGLSTVVGDDAVRPVELQGVDNRTFRLGDELSVRLPSAEHYREQVAKEQYWLPRLAPRLPVPIPSPVAVGHPGRRYRWTWSVNRWLPGSTALAAGAGLGGEVAFARDAAGFLTALWTGDPAGDLVLTWTFLSGAGREAFRAAMGSVADDAMRARARGWALWKAMITYDSHVPRVRAEA